MDKSTPPLTKAIIIVLCAYAFLWVAYYVTTNNVEAGNFLFVPLICTIAAIYIIYFIIQAAVQSGSKDIKNQIRFQNNLKVLEMQKQGFDDQELVKLRNDTLNS